MDKFFASGGVVDFVLAFMGIELIVVILVRKKMGWTATPLELGVGVGAGAALLMALREALRESAWPRIAIWLLVALGWHLWDLKLRLATRRMG